MNLKYSFFCIIVTKKDRAKLDVTQNVVPENTETKNGVIGNSEENEIDILLRSVQKNLNPRNLTETFSGTLTPEQIAILLDSSTIEKPINIKATLNCNYFSSYANGINVKKNDVVIVIYKKDDWVYVNNKRSEGFVPYSYCTFQNLDGSVKKRKLLKRISSKKDIFRKSKDNQVGINACDKTHNKKHKDDKRHSVHESIEDINQNSQCDITTGISKEDINATTKESLGVTKETTLTEEISANKEIKHDISNSESDIHEKPVLECVRSDIEEDVINSDSAKGDIKQDCKYSKEDIDSKVVESGKETLTKASELSENSNVENKSVTVKDVNNSNPTLHELNTENSEALQKIKKSRSKKNTKKITEGNMNRIKDLVFRKTKKCEKDKPQHKIVVTSSSTKRWSGGQMCEWYNDLFNDSISTSGSSESDSECTSTTDGEFTKQRSKRVKKTDIRGRIQVDFAVQKRKYYGKEVSKRNSEKRRNSDLSSLSVKTQAVDDYVEHKNSAPNNGITTSGYAQIRKTETLQNRNNKNSINLLQSKDDLLLQSKDDMLTLDTSKNNIKDLVVSENSKQCTYKNMKKQERIKYSVKSDTDDVLHSPLVVKKITDPKVIDQNNAINENKIIKENEISPLSENKMLVSYDFIASDENDVTILTGQHVEVIKKPDDDWWWVRTSDGREGFVPKTFLALIPKIPSRKPDLIQKLHSKIIDTDSNNNNNNNNNNNTNKTEITEPRNVVTLHSGPMNYNLSDSARLAKVAPLIRETEDTEKEEKLYKVPPSYNQHIMHRQHTELMEAFYKTTNKNEYQSPIRTWKSQEHFTYNERSDPPRIIRRKSFSGRQKKVRFSNSVEYDCNPDQVFVIAQYDLQSSTCNDDSAMSYIDNSDNISTWC